MRARVYVTLKPGVHDPAGKAVQGGLSALGYAEVHDVRIGKYFELEVAEGSSKERIEEMCRKLLANTVIENYVIDLEP